MKRAIGFTSVAALILLAGSSAVAQYGGPPPPPGQGYDQRGGPPGPPPGQGGNNVGSTLRINQSLMRGDSMISNNGQYRLQFQVDGNVVLTDMRHNRILWDTGTAGARAFQLTMQGDGNVVLYTRRHEPIWDTGITGPAMRHGQVFVLQDDGNLVVYSRGQVYWASNTQRRAHYGPPR